jgi:hypothetical protein
MFALDTHTRLTITAHFRRNKAFAWSEDFFLSQILPPGAKKHDVYWSTIALRDCGTTTSVPALKALSAYPMQDVKDCAILTIAQIAGEDETDYFVERLIDPKGRNRAYPLWALGAFGDQRALPAIELYVRKNKKKLSAPSIDAREQQEILAFLHRQQAHALLQEFAFLIAPLKALTPKAMENFMQRVPGLQIETTCA